MISRTFSIKFPVILLAILLSGIYQLSACDSSMLEILTGNSAQQDLTIRMLAITQKMQQTGSFLNAFNKAAADKLHREIMENWLSITSMIPSLPTDNSQVKECSELMMRISRDLGKIRRLLEENDAATIHEEIEACITRISLVSAIFSNHQRMRSFLEIELAIFQLRPVMSDIDNLKMLLQSSNLPAMLANFATGPASSSVLLINNVIDCLNSFLQAVEIASPSSSISITKAMPALLNSFISLKQHLLNTGFFRNQ